MILSFHKTEIPASLNFDSQHYNEVNFDEMFNTAKWQIDTITLLVLYNYVYLFWLFHVNLQNPLRFLC